MQRFATLDVVSQSAPNLRDETTLILRISERLGGELGGAQIEIRTGQFGMLAHGFAGSHALIPNDRRRCGALLTERPLFDRPAVAIGVDTLRAETPPSISFLALDGHHITTGALQGDLIFTPSLGLAALAEYRSIASNKPGRIF